MDELFLVIGKLYVDMYSMQKYIEQLQNQLKDKQSSDSSKSQQTINDEQ